MNSGGEMKVFYTGFMFLFMLFFLTNGWAEDVSSDGGSSEPSTEKVDAGSKDKDKDKDKGKDKESNQDEEPDCE